MSSKKLKAQPNVAAATPELKDLPRRKIRYWCYRFKTEQLEGVSADGAPYGLKDYFEKLEWFSSWLDFGVKWDVREDNPLAIRPLKENLEDVWNRTVLENSRELPIKTQVN